MFKGRINILLNILLICTICLTTVVHSAFNEEMMIDGVATLRVDENIRITSVKAVDFVNGS